MIKKAPKARLKELFEFEMTETQRALAADMISSRGASAVGGPFGVFLRAPTYGDHAQKLGAFCRYRTTVPARLSEFAILVIARLWRAQYEWYVHAPIAEKEGVSTKTISDLRNGRTPKLAAKDELVVYAFIHELHKNKRVSDKTYGKLNALLGEVGMVEFTGILGYYTLIAMTLNVFNVRLPAGELPAFQE